MEIARVVLAILLALTAIFLILLVLIQRGRGGGLAGAFGGMGGQSAFGTKAGDLFTRVTIVTAAIWIILCAASVKIFNAAGELLPADAGGTTNQIKIKLGDKASGPAAAKTSSEGDDSAAKDGAAGEKTEAPIKSGATEPKDTAPKAQDKGPAAPAAPAAKDKTPADKN